MEIYLSDCNSLPEQVEINRQNIKNIMEYLPIHGFWKKNIKIFMETDVHKWHYDETTQQYVYYIVDSLINEDTLVMITPSSNTVLTPLFIESYNNITLINSYNGGIQIYSKQKPKIDLNCNIYYNSNVTNNN